MVRCSVYFTYTIGVYYTLNIECFESAVPANYFAEDFSAPIKAHLNATLHCTAMFTGVKNNNNDRGSFFDVEK